MSKRGVLFVLTLALLAVTLVVCSCGSLFSNSGGGSFDVAWVVRYDGGVADDDGGQAVAVDVFGNVYVTGYSWSDASSIDYATIKYDIDGNEVWLDRYDGPAHGEDWALDMAIDASGNLYVTGWSYGVGTETDAATIKYDPEGNRLWVARYDGPVSGHDLAYAVEVDYAGNTYVTGWGQGNNTQADCVTMKYDQDGEQLWAARYNGPASGEDKSLAVAVDGWANVYVTGSSQGENTEADFVTVKYDTEGNQLWVARYDGPASGEDNAQAIYVDSWGNVYVTGWSDGAGTGPDYATVKYDTNGAELWAARYDGPANGEDMSYAIAVDTSGSAYVTGFSMSSENDADYATVKYDSAGNLLWAARYDGPAHAEDTARAMDMDGWGNIYIGGWSRGDGVRYDYAMIKYGPDGDQLAVARFNGPAGGHDKIYALAVDVLGNAYVTGRSSGIETYYDYTTIKYAS